MTELGFSPPQAMPFQRQWARVDLSQKQKHLPLRMSLHTCYSSDMDTQGKETRITIRFPAEVIVVLRQLAKQHDRSLNGEIVWALREYIVTQQETQQ